MKKNKSEKSGFMVVFFVSAMMCFNGPMFAACTYTTTYACSSPYTTGGACPPTAVPLKSSTSFRA